MNLQKNSNKNEVVKNKIWIHFDGKIKREYQLDNDPHLVLFFDKTSARSKK